MSADLLQNAVRGWLAAQDRAGLLRLLSTRIGTAAAESTLDQIEAMGRLLTQPFADGQSLRDDEWPSWGEAGPAIKALRARMKDLKAAIEAVQAIGLDPDRWASESALLMEEKARAKGARVAPENRIQLAVLHAELSKIDAWAATWRAADFKRKKQSSSRSIDFVRMTVDILRGAGISVSSHRQGITAKTCDAVLRAAAFRKTADVDLRKVLRNIQ